MDHELGICRRVFENENPQGKDRRCPTHDLSLGALVLSGKLCLVTGRLAQAFLLDDLP
jgi:hypothetical protein